MGLYGNEYFTEGVFFHSEESKKFRKEIVDEIKAVNGGDKFLDRLANSARGTMPSNDKIKKINAKFKSISDECYVTDPIKEARTSLDGNSTYTVYCIRFFCIKGKSIIKGGMDVSGYGFGKPYIIDASLDNRGNLSIDDFKTAIDIAEKNKKISIDFGVYLGKGDIKFKDTQIGDTKFIEDFYNSIANNSAYEDKYTFTLNDYSGTVTMKKK